MHEDGEQLIGSSTAMRDLREEVGYAARSDAKILITGESGVGKEILARLIHRQSTRARAQLVTINCAGLPDSLLESELFGHVRGSFTGAYRDKAGLLELAHNGTIFMDEVGEMSLRMQALLLRFLESGEIQRVGAERAQARVNVRVIAATNRNLTERIASKDFREDLYYRLNVVHLRVPTLRERPEDVPLLLDYFVREFVEHHRLPRPVLADEARARLLRYEWPGNVRELRNVIERAMILAPGPVLEIAPPPAGTAAVDASSVGARTAPGTAGLTREALLQVLESCGWRIRGRSGAAERLGLKPTTVEYRMAKLGIKRP
jgi:transcriptional regulator with GAF, ATPase, and Fis domain